MSLNVIIYETFDGKILILQTTTIQNRTFDILLLILSLVNKRGKTFTPNKMKVQKSTFQSVHISKTFYTKKNLFPRISFSKLKLLHKRKYFDNAIIIRFPPMLHHLLEKEK